MKIVTAIAVALRLVTLLLVSLWLVGLASPTPDPLAVALAWTVTAGLALSVPVSRRMVSRWVVTGRLRRLSA